MNICLPSTKPAVSTQSGTQSSQFILRTLITIFHLFNDIKAQTSDVRGHAEAQQVRLAYCGRVSSIPGQSTWDLW